MLHNFNNSNYKGAKKRKAARIFPCRFYKKSGEPLTLHQSSTEAQRKKD